MNTPEFLGSPLAQSAMWCSTCQQDVPAIAVPEHGNRLGCARCHGSFGERTKPEVAAASDIQPGAAEATPDPSFAPPPLDDWNLDADLAAVTRLMQSLRLEHAGVPAVPSSPTSSRTKTAFHDLHPAQALTGHHFHAASTGKRSHWFAWPALMLGMMGFTCGAVLLTWSFLTGRGDLWTYGMPAVLGGQALLVLGLVLQLEGLWHNNRETRDTLQELDRELAELRHATTLLTSSQSSAGQSFYAHMAEGASPNLLLADVKGQLDLIAARLSQSRER